MTPAAAPVLHVFDDSARFGRALARVLGARARKLALHRFPDGESLVRVTGEVPARAVLVRSLDDPNAKLIEVLLAADALRRAGARHVTLVAPYLAYMRQDAVFRAGEPISQRVVAGLLGGGFERVITVEPHLHRIARLDEIMDCDAIAVPAADALHAWVSRSRPRPLLVGPDEESEPWVRALARTAELPWAVGRKVRRGDARVQVALPDLPASRRAVIVDDIASTGATLVETARALRRAGIERIDVAAVHALFAPGALRRIRAAGIERIVTTDTVAHETNRIRVAPLVAKALLAR